MVTSVYPLPSVVVRAVLKELAWTAAWMDLWRSMQVQPFFDPSDLFLVIE